nr:uncharacterized protein LOC106621900 [Bactrocera oleae]
MQMDACLRRLCVCCSVCRKIKARSAYIKYNNGKLSATQPTNAAINITKTLATTASLTLPQKPTTKAHSSHKSSSTVRRITSLACRSQRPAKVKSVQRLCKWYSQAQLTLVAVNGCTGNYSHSVGSSARTHLTTIRYTLNLLHHVFVCVIGVALTILLQRCCVGKTTAIPKRTQTHSPLANSLRLAAGKSHWPQALHTPTTMGSCFGRCVSKDANGGGVASTATSCLWRRQQHATDEQEAELVSNASDKCPRENFIYRIIKFKTKQKRPQFIDKFWEQQDMQYTRLTNRNGTEGLSDIQLQNLDVHNLLSNAILAKESALNYCLTEAHYAAASSRASSSLDLEWEHEYAHMRQLYQPPPHMHRSTQSLLHTSTLNSNNNLAQYTNSNNNTPIHHLHTLNNNHHMMSLSKRSHTYDNHPLHVHLNDSWQYLSNDDDQLNSLASYSQSQSLPHAPLNAAAMALATAKAVECGEQRIRTRRVAPPPINERRNSSFTRTCSSHNSWSHISTPESLEWDQDEEQQRQLRVEDDNLDDETLELLHQIEQLKNRVLDETGDGLYDDGLIAAGESETGEGMQFMIGGQYTTEDGRKDIS